MEDRESGGIWGGICEIEAAELVWHANELDVWRPV